MKQGRLPFDKDPAANSIGKRARGKPILTGRRRVAQGL